MATIPVENVIPYDKNAKKHPKKQVEQVAASIKEFGFNQPIVVDKDGVLIVGHGRLEAAKLLGLKEVPVIVADLTEEQAKAYRLADNKLNESDWDMNLVIEELKGLSEPMLDLTGFDSDLVIEADEKDDEVPEIPEEPQSKLGDLYELGNHRVLCGDSTNLEDVERLMDGVKPDFVFSDPPYGIDVVQNKSVGGGGPTKFGTVGSSNIVKASTYSEIIGDDTTDTAQDFYNTCVALGYPNIALWGGNYFTDFLRPSRCWIIWDKEMTGNFSEAEMAWTSFTKGGVKVFKHLWNGLSREGNRKDELSKRVHPTQKPVGLFVEIFTRFDGFKTIFDGFLGSGSTLIASEKTGRICYGMELDPKYVDVIVQRYVDYTGDENVVLNGKKIVWKKKKTT